MAHCCVSEVLEFVLAVLFVVVSALGLSIVLVVI